MEKKYMLTAAEYLSLFVDVFKDKDLSKLSPVVLENMPGVITFDTVVTAHNNSFVKFTNYDVHIVLNAPKVENLMPGLRKIAEQEIEYFKQKEEELLQKTRIYKAEKFGNEFVIDCDNYVAAKRELQNNIESNVNRVAELEAEIAKYEENTKSLQNNLLELEKE